ncbi:MAG TPA: DUF3168 domain-containing protein [Thermoguttaceae bacterium]|nr:DUF3168 domain-containing protein [Thermoguttaceae bacterium]
MNLAEVIHQRWAAAGGLNGLLPATSVYTGLSVDPEMPYAVISKRSDRPMARHNDGSGVDAVGVRIEVFHDNRDAAATIVEQVKTTFDRTDFTLSGSDKVINVQRVNDSERQNDDGVWQMTIDFHCAVYLAPGA